MAAGLFVSAFCLLASWAAGSRIAASTSSTMQTQLRGAADELRAEIPQIVSAATQAVEWRIWGGNWPAPTMLVRDGLVNFAQKTRMSQAPDTARTETPDPSTVFLQSVLSVVVWVVLVLLVAILYNSSYAGKPLEEEEKEFFKQKDFLHGPFNCFEDPEICVWSCCCGGIRWADTMNRVSILGFWIALIVFLALHFLNAISGGVVIWIVVALIFTYFRQQFRKSLGMNNSTEDVVKDCALWCCCACCAIAQEARQVKMKESAGKAQISD